MTTGRVLVLAYGNPARQDDGLGPALAGSLERLALPGVTVEADYQPRVEDAAGLAGHEVVVFVDAAVAGPEPFSFGPLEPAAAAEFGTHALRPEEVLALAREAFAASPRAYLLAIRGYEFAMFVESLTAGATANLEAATGFLQAVLRGRDLAGAPGPAATQVENAP